jgi:hypothetical protein
MCWVPIYLGIEFHDSGCSILIGNKPIKVTTRFQA